MGRLALHVPTRRWGRGTPLESAMLTEWGIEAVSLTLPVLTRSVLGGFAAVVGDGGFEGVGGEDAAVHLVFREAADLVGDAFAG